MEASMIDRYIISFMIYSFFGYLSEVTYCSIPAKRFVNRGFLYGPYLPIYGFGGLIVVIILSPLHAHPIAVFALAMILTSILEYFTSWLLEKLFSIKLWDYSRYKLNINGRVCLLNSTLFGNMGIVLEYMVNPFVSRLIDRIPLDLLHSVALIAVSIISVDTAVSTLKMISFREGLKRIRAMRNELDEKIKAIHGEGKAELALELKARMEENIEHFRAYFHEKYSHIVKANPTLTARNNEIRNQLALYKEWIDERRKLKRKYKEELSHVDSRHIEEIREHKHD